MANGKTIPRRILGLFLRLLEAIYLMVVRSALLILTLVISVHFIVTTPMFSKKVMELVSQVIPGSIEVQRVFWRPYSGQVLALGVRITRPGDNAIITADLVRADMRLWDLILAVLNPDLLNPQPLPIIIDRATVYGSLVYLEFSDDGLEFVKAFVDPDAPPEPDDEPSGPPPWVMIRNIETVDAHVILDFPGWGLDITGAHVFGTFFLEEGIPNVRAHQITVDQVLFTGHLPVPPQVDFLTLPVRNVSVGTYSLTASEPVSMEFTQVVGANEKLDFQVTGSIVVGDEPMPVFEAKARIRSDDPLLLGDLTSRAVVGPIMADAVFSGPVTTADLSVVATTPRLEVLQVPFEEVRAKASMNLGDPLKYHVDECSTWQEGAYVEAREVDIQVMPVPGDIIRISGDACFEAAAAAYIAMGFADVDITDVSPLLDVTLSGCTTIPMIRVGEEDVELMFTVQAFGASLGDPGLLPDSSLQVAGDVHLTDKGLTAQDLELVLGSAEVLAQGGLKWNPELEFSLEASLSVGELADYLTIHGLEDIQGELELRKAEFSGTLEEPALALTLDLYDLITPATSLEHLSLTGDLEGGLVSLSPLCWTTSLTKGCIEGDALLFDQGFQLQAPPWQVSLDVEEPITLDLKALGLIPGTEGLLSMPSFHISGMVGTRLEHFYRGMETEGEVSFQSLKTPFGSLGPTMAQWSLELNTVKKEPRLGGSLLLDTRDVVAMGMTSDHIEITAGVDSCPLSIELADIKRLVGELNLEVEGFHMDFLNFYNVALNFHLPEQGMRSFSAALELSKGIGTQLTGEMDPQDLSGFGMIKLKKMPISAFPLPAELHKQLELFKDVLVSGRVRLDWPELEPLLALPLPEILAKLTISGSLAATDLGALPEPVHDLAADFSLHDSRLSMPKLEVHLPGGEAISGNLNLNLKRMKGSGRLKWSPLRLSRIEFLRSLELPLDARVAGDLEWSGTIPELTLDGEVEVQDLVVKDIPLGRADLKLKGQIGKTITVTASRFFRDLDLMGCMLRFKGPALDRIDAMVGFKNLTLKEFLPDLDLPLSVEVSGTAAAEVTPTRDSPFSVAILLEKDELKVDLPMGEELIGVRNSNQINLTLDQRGVRTRCVELQTPFGPISVQGELSFRSGFNLGIGGVLDLASLKMLAPYLARFGGRVMLGSTSACGLMGDRFRLKGDLTRPEISGPLVLTSLRIQPRHFPSEFTIPTGEFQVAGRLDTGDLTISIPEGKPLTGQMDEGSFRIWGSAELAGFTPHQISLKAEGSNIFFSQPRQFRMTMNPILSLSLTDPLDPDKARGLLSGELEITDGEFYRNFDRLLGSFTSAFSSRSQDRYSKPITEVLPFLSAVKLDLVLRSSDFTVASRFPFGETDMDVALGLRVRGDLKNLQLYDRLSLIPGGSITYKVVKREFEIVSGYADFSGDPAAPTVDVKAQTYVKYMPTDASGYVSDYDRSWGKEVQISIRVYGAYPKLQFELSSESEEFDQADLQTLMLLGMTRRDLESRSAESGDISINVLTDDVAKMVSKLLLAPFLDDVSLGFTQDGGIQAETLTKIGRAIELTTKVHQEEDMSEYSAGFRFKLTDRITLEGRLKTREEADLNLRAYEGRLRYRVPLE